MFTIIYHLFRVSKRNVHGTNPQHLIERITLVKIWECRYWKEKCFGVNSEMLIDEATLLKFCGGTYGGLRKPCEFLCLTCKLLQLQPEKGIIETFISQDDYKYVRVLGAFYLRLVGKPLDIYKYLEPLLLDWRKVVYRAPDGKYTLTYVDEIVDNLLTKDTFFNIVLPRIPSRLELEKQGKLPPRKSALEDLDNFDVELSDDEDKEEEKSNERKKKERNHRRDRRERDDRDRDDRDRRDRRVRERRDRSRERRSRSRGDRRRRSPRRDRRRRRSRSDSDSRSPRR